LATEQGLVSSGHAPYALLAAGAALCDEMLQLVGFERRLLSCEHGIPVNSFEIIKGTLTPASSQSAISPVDQPLQSLSSRTPFVI
jgi:hypothetical protein